MPLVQMQDMLSHAYRHRYAVGAFDVVSLDFVEGVMEAAERCRAPIILSIAESHFDLFDVELLLPAMETAARRARVPVAIHLDHGSDLESAVRGIRLGCNGVMIDASHHPLEENVARTAAVVRMARGCGVPVEGELGYVPGIEGEDAVRHAGEMCYTGVEEAREYVAQTGVDFLAVSVGTVHGRFQGEPQLDLQRLAEINEILGIPLVIHGGTGLSDAQFQGLIANGVTKINYFTALDESAGESVRERAQAGTGRYSGLLKDTRRAVARETERCIRLWGGADRAAEVLAGCRPWTPVEHLILYNLGPGVEHRAESLMAAGRSVLAAIPGVRKVVTGTAMKQDARYRHCWLVRFAHPEVIASYRDHPDHVAFADREFRPVAGDRISIDYSLD